MRRTFGSRSKFSFSVTSVVTNRPITGTTVPACKPATSVPMIESRPFASPFGSVDASFTMSSIPS
ncbi:hypothetical protein ACFPRL_30210 [Pseudoclavibacter helvolus]